MNKTLLFYSMLKDLKKEFRGLLKIGKITGQWLNTGHAWVKRRCPVITRLFQNIVMQILLDEIRRKYFMVRSFRKHMNDVIY